MAVAKVELVLMNDATYHHLREGLPMLTEITNAAKALEGFATLVEGSGNDQPLSSMGWNSPPVTRGDIALRARRLANRLKGISDGDVDKAFKQQLAALPQRLTWIQTQALPQLGSANAGIVTANISTLLSGIEQVLPVKMELDWEVIQGAGSIPRDLTRKLRSLELRIKNLEPQAGDLEGKIRSINEAHSTALDLPTDLHELKNARDKLEHISDDVKKSQNAVEDAALEASDAKARIVDFETEAQKLVSNIGSAYSAATTVGLAASFSERAKSLTSSTWLWVLMLFVALLAGAVLGYVRVDAFQKAVVTGSQPSKYIWIEAVMSFLSLAAPIWFAWLATRQISQRFRLAEDYGFKAAVARAYEGYRREAARVDPELEKRLFSSALDRLEEAPLRFISVEEHSSPYEALLASAGFQKLIDKLPSADKADVLSILAKAAPGASRIPTSEAGTTVGPSSEETNLP